MESGLHQTNSSSWDGGGYLHGGAEIMTSWDSYFLKLKDGPNKTKSKFSKKSLHEYWNLPTKICPGGKMKCFATFNLTSTLFKNEK